uniref:Uncharacterized protein n=1 Tax=Arundo donax TaxID=35708 RepID=A0A0A9D072_ARUDO
MRLGGCGAPFGGLPPRDPLAPMGNYPYSSALGAASLPSLPMPMEGLKLPMLPPPSLHPFLRQLQAMEAAGLVVPKVEAKGEPAPGNGNNAAAGATASAMQRNQLPLGHQM